MFNLEISTIDEWDIKINQFWYPFQFHDHGFMSIFWDPRFMLEKNLNASMVIQGPNTSIRLCHHGHTLRSEEQEVISPISFTDLLRSPLGYITRFCQYISHHINILHIFWRTSPRISNQLERLERKILETMPFLRWCKGDTSVRWSNSPGLS